MKKNKKNYDVDRTHKEVIIGGVDASTTLQVRPSHINSRGTHGSPCHLILFNP